MTQARQDDMHLEGNALSIHRNRIIPFSIRSLIRVVTSKRSSPLFKSSVSHSDRLAPFFKRGGWSDQANLFGRSRCRPSAKIRCDVDSEFHAAENMEHIPSPKSIE